MVKLEQRISLHSSQHGDRSQTEYSMGSVHMRAETTKVATPGDPDPGRVDAAREPVQKTRQTWDPRRG